MANSVKGRRITVRHKTHSVPEWAIICGISRKRLYKRLQHYPPDVAIGAYLDGERPAGGWPRGRYRNATDGDNTREVLDALRVLLDTQHARGRVSLRVLSDHLSVSDRTVRRWLSGEDMPPAATLKRVAAWVRRTQRDAS